MHDNQLGRTMIHCLLPSAREDVRAYKLHGLKLTADIEFKSQH